MDNSTSEIKTPSNERGKNIIDSLSFAGKDASEDSGFISRFLFIWGYKLIKLAKYTTWNLEYLGILKGHNSSKVYSREIFEVWERYKHSSNALIKTCFRVNLIPMIIIVIGCWCTSMIDIYTVGLFNKFVTSYTKQDVTEESKIAHLRSLWLDGGLYLLIKLGMILIERKFGEYQNHIGYKAGLQLDCLVYRKIWRSSLTNESHAAIADIVNYIQVDSHKLTNSMIASPSVITIPFLIIGYSYMLFEFFGKSFLMGFGTLIFFIIINFCFQKEWKDSQNLHHEHKDQTMKMIIDTLNHIKQIKINGWDEEFLHRIQSSKEMEITNLGRRGYYSNLNNTCLWFAPVMISTVTIGFSQYYRHGIQIADVFTCWKIFSKIETPIRGLPNMWSNFFWTFVSLKRIEQYLNQNEFDDSYVIKDDEGTRDMGIMLKVENGTFTWGKIVNWDARRKSIACRSRWGTHHSGRTYSKFSKNTANKIKMHNLNSSDYSINTGNDDELSDHLLPVGTNDSFETGSKRDIQSEISSVFTEVEFTEMAPVITNINLSIYQNEFICVWGATGSGKTSLLESILNNMISVNNDSRIIINGSISYIGQVPWITNDTVKNNVIFHYPYDEEKYKIIVQLCKLQPDLDSLVGGDSTEIGENGINISGGQKSRICLARGFYADKDIYIFDEPTSSIDVRVGMSIIKDGICNYLQGKTRILVTQTIEYAAFADRIIYMKNGEIIWSGRFKEWCWQQFAQNYNWNSNNIQIALRDSEDLRIKLRNINTNSITQKARWFNTSRIEEDDTMLNEWTTQFRISRASIGKDNQRRESSYLFNSDGNAAETDKFNTFNNSNVITNKQLLKVTRTTKDEEVVKGGITKNVIKGSIYYWGGYKLLTMLGFVVIQWQFSKDGAALWMLYWGDHQSPEYNWEYFIVYASFGLAGAILTYLKNRLCSWSCGTTSKNLHWDMVYHLVKAPLNQFHDITPKGQIINRLSRDITTIEDNFFITYASWIAFLTAFIYGIVTCSMYQPYSLIIIPMLGLIGIFLTRFYLNCSRDWVRLEGIVRSPVINTVNETCWGSNTIRAHNYSDVYSEWFYKRWDDLFKVRICLIGTHDWYGLMWDLWSYSLEMFWLLFSLLFRHSYEWDVIAYWLNYCMSWETTLKKLLFDISNFQTTMISMERCLKYSEIIKEAPSILRSDGNLKNWPSKGKVVFNNLTVKYRPETDIRLRDISFEIKPCEKVGIVGRTGSGKSTIALSIGRIIEAINGSIWIDDVDIRKIGLKKLRNSLNVISQDLSLLEGTWRYNIDPLDQYTDEQITEAMKKINFWYICEQSNEGWYQTVTESGMNFSMSERQLIYATRVWLKKSKVVILDEFTSNLDYQTEEMLNKVLFDHFKHSTVLVIAHRIKTVMKCNKVIVLNNGQVVEFDDPNELKEKRDSVFYKLYQKSYLN